MARKAQTAQPEKSPKRLKQIQQVIEMTRKVDKKLVPLLFLAFFLPVIVAVSLAILLTHGDIFSIILWSIAGILAGILLALLLLGRRADKAAYRQIEGQQGAVGAVLKGSLKRGWISPEMPVALNPKTRDAVYRAVGKAGVVLISEGAISRTARLLSDEKRKVSKVLPNVPVTSFTVGDDQESIHISELSKKMSRLKKTLTKSEVRAINNRLSSLSTSIPIPKGIDPYKARPSRKQ